jgi:hypothetical protein
MVTVFAMEAVLGIFSCEGIFISEGNIEGNEVC